MKNFTKSIFISGFPIFSLIIFIRTLISSKYNLGNISLLISSFTIVLFFAMLFIKPVARTSKSLPPFSIIILISLLLSFFNFNKNTVIINLLLAMGWLTYLVWYSSFNSRKTTILEIGKKLANFNLENSKNETINSTSFTGNYKIFLFYRGNWCPLCMAQIQEVVNEYKELATRNVDMILISSQPHKFTQNLAKKHKVPFHFLVDKNNTVAKKLGILHKNGLPIGFQAFGYSSDVVLPTVIITDKNNRIIFANLTDNYRVRPEPKTFLSTIDKHQQQMNS